MHFSGAVDGEPWSYVRTGRCDGPPTRCMDLVGLLLPPVSLLLENTKDGNIGVSAEFGRDTLYAVLTLSDGEQVTLTGITEITAEPNAIAGDYFEMPRGETIVRVDAALLFSSKLVHADPRPLRSDIPTVVPWYQADGKPLSLTPPVIPLGRSGSGGTMWSVEVVPGSWTAQYGIHGPGTHQMQWSPAGVLVSPVTGADGSSAQVLYGNVEGTTVRVDVALSDGTMQQFEPVVHDDRVFVGGVLPAGPAVTMVTYYNAAECGSATSCRRRER
ncbi:hypothetical protein ACFQ9X_53015 [Catenulispora yoronensis]